METKERKHDMPIKKIVKIYDIDTEWTPLDIQLKVLDRDVLVSVDDAGDVAKKEYDSYIKQQEEDDLNNQQYSEGEDYEK